MRHQLPTTDQFALESDGEEALLEALPMLIEAGFQNAGLAAMESDGFSSLPIELSNHYAKSSKPKKNSECLS